MNILNILLKVFLTILKFFIKLSIPIFILIIIFILIYLYNYINFRFVKKIKPKNRKDFIFFEYKNVKYVMEIPYKERKKKTSIFKNIFVLFPKQLAYDYLTVNRNNFREFGIHIVVGAQGSGKTMTVAYLLQEWAKVYPRLKIQTNMAYLHENNELLHWKQLISNNNGIYGYVSVIDEIKTWFSNADSKNVPPEVLSQICQVRKQKKAIIGTVQVFSEMAKAFRSQTHTIYVPKTYLGCLTVVFKTKPQYYNDETDSFKKYTGFFVFAHTKELRESYDTLKTIEKYKNYDFENSVLIDDKGNLVPVAQVPLSNKKK